MKTKHIIAITSAILSLMVLPVTAQTIYFQDNFASDSSGNYTEFEAAETTIENNTFYGYDYTADTDSVGATIPSAPRTTDASKKALKTEINMSVSSINVVCLYPNITPITGDHRLVVDVFYRYVTTGLGTENFGIGLLHSGSKVLCEDYIQGTGSVPASTDGYFHSHAPDAGWATRDCAFYEGIDTGNSVDQHLLADGDFSWPGDIAGQPEDSTISTETTFFEALTPTAAASWVDNWATWEIRIQNGVVRVTIDNQLVCTYNDPDDTFASGIPSLHHEDAFASTCDSFMLFDNLLIEEIPLPLAADGTWILYE